MRTKDEGLTVSPNGQQTDVRRSANSAFNIGDMCIAFDSNSWMKTGDIGDNSCFAKRAQVLNVRQTDDGEWLADVRFEDGRTSNGHYQDTLQHCAYVKVLLSVAAFGRLKLK